MSLLLDALKKAADEKSKAADSTENSAEEQSAALKQNKSNSNDFTRTKSGEQEDDFDLSLDDDALQSMESQAHHSAGEDRDDGVNSQEDYDRLSEVVSTHVGDDEGVTSSSQSETTGHVADRAGGSLDYNVSDEALDLLINKANRSYRKNKIIWIVLVSVVSLAVLVAGGVYFTENMKSEVAFLETRYNQSLRSIREKTSKESLPDKSVIIENLVSDEDLAKKVEFTKTELAKQEAASSIDAQQDSHPLKQRADKANKKASRDKSYLSQPVLSIEKSQQADPVSLLLDEAWLAYKAGDYDQSDNAYEEVLRIEKNNRDALLGRGAIALQKKTFNQAKAFYSALLEINPGDPDAITALTSLEQTQEPGEVAAGQTGTGDAGNAQTTKSEKYLKSLLQKNAQSPGLNFSLGSVYANQKRWALAQEHFFKAWVNDNENAGYAYNLAVSLDQMGKTKEAKRFYEESLRLSENKKVQFSKQSVLDRIVQIN